MATVDDEKLIQQIDELVVATREGRIQWGRANPTTYTWQPVSSPPVRTTLQRIETLKNVATPRGMQPQKVRSHVLQVEQPVGSLVMTDTRVDSDPVGAKLSELYQAASDALARKGLDILHALIPPKLSS
jgi:hypothetical protein